MEEDDRTLLSRWAESGDDHAVRELTHRYSGLVMGTASRALSGNQLLAEEAAQVVFTVMTAKAASLRNHPSLRLWLHRAALLEAAGMRRREARHRRNLERLSEQLHAMPRSEPAPFWQRALPQLDEAMERLPAGDRLLLLLRFFEGRNFKDIAARLGKSDDTVQKQTTRAVQKLSRLLVRRGAAIPVTALTAGLAGIAAVTPEAPAALSIKFAAAAISGAPDFRLTTSLNHTLKLMTFTQSTKLTGLAAVLLLLLCGLAGYHSGVAAAAGESASTGTAENAEASGNTGNPDKTRSLSSGVPGAGISATTAPHPKPKPPLRDTLKAAAEIEMGINGGWGRIPESQAPLLAYYDIADTEEAIALLPEFRGNDGQFESVAGLIFNVLADADWRKARDRLLKGDSLRGDGKLSGQAVRLIADIQGREDPAAAFLWANELVDEGRAPFPTDRGLGEGLLAEWFERDPAAALTEMDRRVENQPRLIGPAVRRSLRIRPQWWIDQLSTDAPPADRARMLRIARSALVMVPEDKWLESLESCTKNPEAAKTLLPLLKP